MRGYAAAASRPAGLDVLPAEPGSVGSADFRLESREEWIRDRLVITPHAAFLVARDLPICTQFNGNALAFLCHGKLQNCVNERELLQATAR